MANAQAADRTPTEFWRSLNYFNLYRFGLATVILALLWVSDVHTLYGETKGRLFEITAWLYALSVLLSFMLLQKRWTGFSWQLAVQVSSDIAALTVMAYASGGVLSSVGLLLMVSLAVAGMISSGRFMLFFAALASIAALLEHAYAVLHDGAPAVEYIQVGFLCMAYFAAASLAYKLARYALENQNLAQRRGRDLIGMAEANRLVMRDMQDGVLVLDEHDRILQMNPSALQMLHNLGISGSLLSEAFPLLYEQYEQWRRNALSGRETLQLDGGLQARLRFVGVERQASQGAVIFMEDMRHVQAEAQQIKLAALGRLTANLAHEVRNPLSAISYATELLQEETHDARQERLLQLIKENTQRINRIVEDVMQLNRRDRARPETFDLAALLPGFADEFSQAERVEQGVVVLKVVQVGSVTFDRGHFRQVLWNLCRNALYYGKHQAGSLTIATSMERGRVILEVQDDGPGVLPEHRSRLFEPFFTTAEQGTGLGLYIAKELCDANGAWLEYVDAEHRAVEQGACFRITFGERRYMKRPESEHGG